MTVPLPPIPDLPAALRQLIAQVPAGRVTTCGMLAEALGNRVAALWVAQYAADHAHEPRCACHRIVRAGGRLGPYIAGSVAEKAQRLAAEGIAIQDDAVDLPRYGFADFRGDRPLARLRELQQSLAAQVATSRRRTLPALVAGVDAAYPQPGEIVAAYALVAVASGELVWSTTVRQPVSFPYITSYLSFRELPALLALIDEVRAADRLAEVLLVDGSGVLHPRQAGIASHLGVTAGLATIGVTKTQLCGEVAMEGLQPGQSRPVRLDGKLRGVALRPVSGTRRPLFISPGHRVDVPFAEQVVRAVLGRRRLPEPIYWADRLSKAGPADARGGSPGRHGRR